MSVMMLNWLILVFGEPVTEVEELHR